MSKKRILTTVVILLTLVALIVAAFQVSVPILKDSESAKVYRVSVVGNDIDSISDVTQSSDLEGLVELLSYHKRSIVSHSFAPIQMTPGTIEISVIDNTGSYHLLLSQRENVVFTSAERGGYTIRNSGKIKQDINFRELIPNA